MDSYLACFRKRSSQRIAKRFIACGATPSPTLVGYRHTLTALPNGQVLATGGHVNDFSVPGAELYDPVAGTWAATTPLNRCRAAHTATLLPNGKVLIAGGFDGSCCDWRDTLETADLFDIGLLAQSVGTSESTRVARRN